MAEESACRVVPAPHPPLIERSLFDLAQAIRLEKAATSVNRVGRPRSYSTSRCGRVNLLQGVLLCGRCGHAMAPHYTYKPPKGEKAEAF